MEAETDSVVQGEGVVQGERVVMEEKAVHGEAAVTKEGVAIEVTCPHASVRQAGEDGRAGGGAEPQAEGLGERGGVH